MAAASIYAASSLFVLFVSAFVHSRCVFAAPQPSHTSALADKILTPDAGTDGTAAEAQQLREDARDEDVSVGWQEYAEALQRIVCPVDKNILSCLERRVMCELKSTIRKQSNFSVDEVWFKYVEDGCDAESSELNSRAHTRESNDIAKAEEVSDLSASDVETSSRDAARIFPQNIARGITSRTVKMSSMMPLMLLGPLIMFGLLPFTLANLKGMVMMAMMLSNVALMSAISTTIRNVVFGRRPGHHVVYNNYGYGNEHKQKWVSHQPTVIHHG